MASNDSSISQNETTPAAVEQLTKAVASAGLQDGLGQVEPTESEKDTGTPLARPMIIYTRAQIVYLHKSPLVRPPEGMPELNDWFGLENVQNLTRKEPEMSSPPSTNRDRRFRRDADDGDVSSRTGFRSTLAQPSQMGNFKHQSLRTADRDRDRDTDRDRDGHERLRNLSDKYDRDRLAPGRKERDTAPHLTSGASSRLSGQAQGTATSSRRTEGRDGTTRKPREANDDWRRGTDGQRIGRDDRSDTTRRDREDRERPRSRVRESSRHRRDTSLPRRERERDRDRNRDREDRDRDRDRRDRDRTTTRDGDSRDWERVERRDRGPRDSDSRYDRDDRESADHDDPRRWRDDGRRDERIAARRTAPADREWNRDDDRGKRNLPRPKRANGADERDDRQEREREKEKEPAWMDNYDPSAPSVLGNKAGELDGIQAFKKSMKEKEAKTKGGARTKDVSVTASSPPAAESDAPENPLDEIQQFKLLMKREAGNRVKDGPMPEMLPSAPKAESSVPADSVPGARQSSPPGLSANSVMDSAIVTAVIAQPGKNAAPSIEPPSANGPISLLSLLGQPQSNANPLLDTSKPPPGLVASPDPNRPSSRQTATQATLGLGKPQQESSPAPAALHTPPVGSRLLAFGSRSSSNQLAKAESPNPPFSSAQNGLSSPQPVGNHSDMHINSPGLQQGPSRHDPLRGPGALSPLEARQQPSPSVLSNGFDPAIIQASDTISRRPPQLTDNGPLPDHNAILDPSTNVALASSKGSRFAKFFDGKGKDGAPPPPKLPAPSPIGSATLPSQASSRQDPGAPNAIGGVATEHRAMEDIFAMLSNSVQVNLRNEP
ncbi:hypothetical protein HGRIS_007724 [Hohenbuehelia grisea]|uniref:Nipped-B-like protein B n=1 Tax=Hohenbuehelia grisea TaxID=104357 RepID=A0ABR3J637_9AGAR